MEPNCIICNSQCAFLLKIGKGYILHYCKNCFHIQSNTAQSIGTAQKSAQSIRTGTESSTENNDIFSTKEPHQFIQKFKASDKKQLIIELPTKSFVTECDYEFTKLGQVSFFCTNSLKLLCDKNGVYLNKVTISDNGNICSYFIEKECNFSNSIIEKLLHEIEKELYNERTYFKYTSKCIILKNTIQNYILIQKLIDLF